MEDTATIAAKIESLYLDDFSLTSDEAQKYYYHIDVAGPELANAVFEATPILARCTPSLFLPFRLFPGYSREFFIWDRTTTIGPSTLGERGTYDRGWEVQVCISKLREARSRLYQS